MAQFFKTIKKAEITKRWQNGLSGRKAILQTNLFLKSKVVPKIFEPKFRATFKSILRHLSSSVAFTQFPDVSQIPKVRSRMTNYSTQRQKGMRFQQNLSSFTLDAAVCIFWVDFHKHGDRKFLSLCRNATVHCGIRTSVNEPLMSVTSGTWVQIPFLSP